MRLKKRLPKKHQVNAIETDKGTVETQIQMDSTNKEQK